MMEKYAQLEINLDSGGTRKIKEMQEKWENELDTVGFIDHVLRGHIKLFLNDLRQLLSV